VGEGRCLALTRPVTAVVWETFKIQVPQVTHVQASWSEQEGGGAGAFTIQLILDHGASEYVLRPTAHDAQVLLELLGRSSATFDLGRKVLIFGGLELPA
jgi:hypothetical protein